MDIMSSNLKLAVSYGLQDSGRSAMWRWDRILLPRSLPIQDTAVQTIVGRLIHFIFWQLLHLPQCQG